MSLQSRLELIKKAAEGWSGARLVVALIKAGGETPVTEISQASFDCFGVRFSCNGQD